MNDADSRWLAAAAALAERARPLSAPNPPVAAILVRGGRVVGRGWTGAGGRPHAEAFAAAQAGAKARGATLYATLEPCAHRGGRGPACSDLLAGSGIERAVIGVGDPDPRTAGKGIDRLRGAGIAAELANDPACRASLAGYLSRQQLGRPFITLKLAITADGFVAREDGTSKWITGEVARAHGHRERARSDAILVGGSTLRADAPRLDVRLAGLGERSPSRLVLTRHEAPAGWRALRSPRDVHALGSAQHLLIEGGARTAQAFLGEGLVDRLLIYQAPIRFGTGIAAFPAGRPEGWTTTDLRPLGNDTLEILEPAR